MWERLVGRTDCSFSRSGRVSVVIPLYNHAGFIAEAVDSVLDQGDVLHELIVIDDGSKDDSAAVMRQLIARDPRIRFTSQLNEGAHATINRGLCEATGEYLTILNSDDAYLPGRLDALARALDLDEGSAIASSSIAFMDDASAEIANPWFDTALQSFKAKRDFGLAILDANFVMTTSNIMMRRSLFEQLGGFAPLRYAHDMELLLRCAANGARLAFVDRRLLRYRFHSSNTIHESHDRVRMEWALCGAFFLHLGWQRRSTRDWARAQAVQEVLERHNLLRAASLMVMRFAQAGATRIEDAGILEDVEFNPLLRGIL
jgi:glycosyltransferase involved in cell wall biosynthesis